MSPVDTFNGSFVCVLWVVVVSNASDEPSANAFKFAWVITGSLETVGATPFIDVMNFLNAKSNAFVTGFNTSKSSSSS